MMRYIIFAALLQTLVSILLLAFNSKKERSDYLLTALLMGISWHLFTKFYIFTQIDNPTILFMMHTFVQFSYGPLLYMYAEKKRNKNFIAAKLWYLLVPLFMSMTMYGGIVAAFYWFPENADAMLDFYNKLTFFPIVAMHIGFGVITFIKNKKNDIVEHDLIQSVSILLILIGVAEIVLTTASNNFPRYIFFVRSVLYSLLGMIPVFVVLYKDVSAKNIWSATFDNSNLHFQKSVDNIENENKSLNDSKTSSNHTPERKVILSIDQHREIYKEIESLVEKQKLYKDEDLSLDKLATMSGYSRHYISETLNVYAKKSFYHYINEYRIKEVIRFLDDQHLGDLNFLTIAYSSGFKNKASFNQYFKKFTGETPSGYIQQKTL